MSEVACKGCGAQIRGLVAAEQAGEITKRGNKTVIRERVVLACLPNYREVLLQASDGSRHVTCMCDQCASKLSDPVLAEAVYCMDLEQWSKEGAVHPSHIDRKMGDVLQIDKVIQ
jgi:hypothetical protein